MNKRAVVIIVIVIICGLISLMVGAQKENYLSDDPLFGSFSTVNGAISDKMMPTDFLVSIDVSTANETLREKAKESGVSLDEGCWVYSYDEDKVFHAQKSEESEGQLLVYEDGKVIGTLNYSYNSILWLVFGEKYEMTWRGATFELNKDLQGFIFP